MPVDLGLDDDEDTIRRRKRAAQRVSSPEFVLRWVGTSSTGLRRNDNQDSWGERGGSRFVIADGVGGVAGGAFASSIAVTNYLGLESPIDWVDAVRSVDKAVVRQCQARNNAGAATTIVGIDVSATTATVVHAGDSRAYLLRDAALLCLTEDHNVANLRRAEGYDPRGTDDRGKPRSLTSYLGAGDPELVVGVLRFTIKSGDRLLLCTDGVHEQISAEQLSGLLASAPFDNVAARLVAASDAAGGRDNATALVVQVGAP